MKTMQFAEWLEYEDQLDEAARLRANPEEMENADQVMQMINIGDMVELGLNTQSQGVKMPKYGKVISVKARNQIEVEPFGGGKSIIIPAKDLYHVDIADMPYQHQKQLSAVGANNFWQKRTPRQRSMEMRRREREAQQTSEPSSIVQTQRHITPGDIKRVRGILMGDEPKSKQQDTDPLASIFSNEPPQKQPGASGPLSRFVRGGVQGDKLDAIMQQK